MVDYGLIALAVFDFFALLVSFFALCIVCDEHLVPAVEVFIVQFQVPEEVAAVTLVAFGSAAPELFLNSVSAVAHTSDLSLAAILGSGIIAFGLIPPLCIINAPHAKIKLKLFPIMRECGFYMVGLFVFLGSIQDSEISTFEALVIVGVYLFYTGTVATMYFRNKAATDAAAVTAALTSGITNTASLDLQHVGVEMQERESLIDRDATPTRPKAHVQSLHGGGDGSVGIAHASPERFAFFPTLSRSSSSELTRNRKNRATSGTLSTGIRTSNSNTVMSELIRENNSNSPDGRNRSILNTNNDSMYNITSPNSPTYNTTNTSTTNTTMNTNTDSGSNSPYLSDTDIESSGLIDDVEGIGGTEQSSDNTTHNMVSLVVNCMYVPVEHVIRALMPALHPQIPHFISGNHHQQHLHQQRVLSTHRVSLLRAVIVLGSCITAIGVLAVCIVLFCESVINRLGFDSTTMGATLVALGAEIPDTVSAVAMARNGYYDGAIAGAIGSQVINVSLGVGVPALLVGLFGDGYLHIKQTQADSLELLTCLLIMVIVSYIMVTIPISTMLTQGKWAAHTIVTKPGAMFQIGVWLCTYVAFIHFNSE